MHVTIRGSHRYFTDLLSVKVDREEEFMELWKRHDFTKNAKFFLHHLSLKANFCLMDDFIILIFLLDLI